MRVRPGLLRQREFIMKDLYTFDIDESSAQKSYDLIGRVYLNLFRELGINVIRARACSGDMGGTISHEYLMISESGEDTLLTCDSCGESFNAEFRSDKDPCLNCQTSSSFTKFPAIEVGHSFMLNTKYTQSFDFLINTKENSRIHPVMTCHGIGITRLISSIAETCNDQFGLSWPISTSPFLLSIIYKDPAIIMTKDDDFDIDSNDLLWDDRQDVTFSSKIKDAYLLGIPNIIVAGDEYEKTSKIEFHYRRTPYEPKFMHMHEVKNYILKK